MAENIIFLWIKYQLIILCKSGLSGHISSNSDRACDKSYKNLAQRIATVNVQCLVMIQLIRFLKLQNKPSGTNFDLKVGPKKSKFLIILIENFRCLFYRNTSSKSGNRTWNWPRIRYGLLWRRQRQLIRRSVSYWEF